MRERNTLNLDVSLFKEVRKVLLAVSGGADSVAMAHVLVGLRKQGCLGCDFVIGHVNHCLRESESDGDEAFVKALAQSLGVPAVTKSVDVKSHAKENKLSIETAGRYLRLKTLSAMARSHQCDCIATAHHKDDLAETMIHRLMRGTGIRGLCGIRSASRVYDTEFIRPMLGVRRAEIIDYCKDNAIQWREDASNRNLGFTRNRIRHQLMPALEARSCGIVNKLHTLSQKSCRFQRFTENIAHKIVTKGQFNQTSDRFSIDRTYLHEAAGFIFYEVIREILVKLGIGLRPYTHEHFESIRDMIAQDRAKADFPGGIAITVENGMVTIETNTEVSFLPPESVTLNIGQTVVFGPWKISSRLLDREGVDVDHFVKTKDSFIEWFDADKISGSIEICCRTEGDRFRPIGRRDEKKVSRFLQDAQLEAEIRTSAFLIKDSEKILWVAPIRMSENVKLTLNTTSVLEIKVSEK